MSREEFNELLNSARALTPIQLRMVNQMQYILTGHMDLFKRSVLNEGFIIVQSIHLSLDALKDAKLFPGPSIQAIRENLRKRADVETDVGIMCTLYLGMFEAIFPEKEHVNG